MAKVNGKGADKRKFVQIDRDNFDEVLASTEIPFGRLAQ